jgi:hypothetical protein
MTDVTLHGTRPSSGDGMARNGLSENHWDWRDIRDADAAREAEIEARVAAARKKADERRELIRRCRLEVEAIQELHDDLVTGIRTWRDWSDDLAGLPAGTRSDAAVAESAEALRQARADLKSALHGGK